MCNDNSVGCPRFSSHLLLLYVGSLAGAKNGIANPIFIYPRVKLVCLVKLLVIKMQVLPVELVQGITFGLFFPTLVSVSAKIAPTGIVTMEMMIRKILIVDYYDEYIHI